MLSIFKYFNPIIAPDIIICQQMARTFTASAIYVERTFLSGQCSCDIFTHTIILISTLPTIYLYTRVKKVINDLRRILSIPQNVSPTTNKAIECQCAISPLANISNYHARAKPKRFV